MPLPTRRKVPLGNGTSVLAVCLIAAIAPSLMSKSRAAFSPLPNPSMIVTLVMIVGPVWAYFGCAHAVPANVSKHRAVLSSKEFLGSDQYPTSRKQDFGENA